MHFYFVPLSKKVFVKLLSQIFTWVWKVEVSDFTKEIFLKVGPKRPSEINSPLKACLIMYFETVRQYKSGIFLNPIGSWLSDNSAAIRMTV